MFAEIPLHPKLVHLPIALAVLMPLLSGGVLLAWWRGWLQPRTWTLVAGAQLLLVVSGMVAMKTGEADEERVEGVVAEAAIHEHEEAAEAFVWSGGAVLALCVLPLLLRRRPQLALRTALVASIGTGVVLGLGYRTGEAGGELVYRHGAAKAYATVGDAAPAVGQRTGDDDDR